MTHPVQLNGGVPRPEPGFSPTDFFSMAGHLKNSISYPIPPRGLIFTAMSTDLVSETSLDPVVPESPMSLAVKVELPSCVTSESRTVELPASVAESLLDLKQSLAVLPVTQNLTHYAVYCGDRNISDLFDELTTYAEIMEALALPSDSGTLHLHLKQCAYNLAAANAQILRFRESVSLQFIDKSAQDFGCSSGVSNFSNLGLTDLQQSDEDLSSANSTKESENEDKSSDTQKAKPRVELSEHDKAVIADLSEKLIQLEEPSIAGMGQFRRLNSSLKIPIKSVMVSQWSPVPAFRRAKGDLLYLTLQTLESEVFHITCHYSGFYVNKSSSAVFNPDVKLNEKGQAQKHYLLYSLVSMLSPQFQPTMDANEKSLTESSPYPEAYLLPNSTILDAPWVVGTEALVNYPDPSRTQLSLLVKSVEGAEMSTDWNEDIQAIRDLPSTNFQERILKERLMHKTMLDFTRTATSTAIDVIRGNLTAMNAPETPDKQIFLKDGIFYTSPAATADTCESTGGLEAARYLASKDLATIKILNRADVADVHSLVTCIVDYMGKRVICQAPIPGIFDSPEEKVRYGVTSDATTIAHDEQFEESFKLIAKVFHLKPHQVELEDGLKSEAEHLLSVDVKGIVGTDRRKYVIDMAKSTPLDIEFIEKHFDSSVDSSYPHAEALVRHEAIEEWWKREVSVILEDEAKRLDGLADADSKSSEEKPEITIDTDSVVFNPDACRNVNESEADQKVVRDLSRFVSQTLVNEFLDTMKSQLAPFDGSHFTELLHRAGINMRYLGHVAEQAQLREDSCVASVNASIASNEQVVEERRSELAAKDAQLAVDAAALTNKDESHSNASEQKLNPKEDTVETSPLSEDSEGKSEDLPESRATFEADLACYHAIRRLAIEEMIVRSAKHLMRSLSAEIPEYLMLTFVSHFFNCFLGKDINTKPQVTLDAEISEFAPKSASSFINLTCQDISAKIQTEVFKRFRYQLPTEWSNEIVRPVQLMRGLSRQFGIQWKAQDYPFVQSEFMPFQDATAVCSRPSSAKQSRKNKKHSAPAPAPVRVLRDSIFVADDIINFVPVIKDSDYKALCILDILQTASSHIALGDNNLGLALLGELVAIQEQIYGIVNPETARLYSLVATVYAELGFDYQAALLARKAIILTERTLGFDSHETITAYMNSAYYEALTMDLTNALKLYSQAFTLTKFVYGKDHPAMSSTLMSIASNLAEANLIEEATMLNKQALNLSVDINGAESEITASVHYRLAVMLLNSGKFAECLEHAVAAQALFTKLLGPDDRYSIHASKYVSNITKYLEYTKLVSEKKKLEAKQSTLVKPKPVGNKAPQSKSKKANSKKNTTKSTSSIATQSVDEILKFIEGPTSGNKKSKK